MTDPIRFTLDGAEVEAQPGETIWQVAQRHGVEIPHLCWLPKPGYRADGNCRACMVEIEGERVLAASCIRRPMPGMKVQAASERAKASRQLVFELLIGDQPERAAAHDPQSRLWQWADAVEVGASRFPRRLPPAPDRSHPAMAVQLDACIHCNLCVPAARCRSMMLSAWPDAVMARRSCSISTTRWAARPASPAASACRPARRAR
jgi:formate dehydrogenase major subunit